MRAKRIPSLKPYPIFDPTEALLFDSSPKLSIEARQVDESS
jgi:hypothetical protein